MSKPFVFTREDFKTIVKLNGFKDDHVIETFSQSFANVANRILNEWLSEAPTVYHGLYSPGWQELDTIFKQKEPTINAYKQAKLVLIEPIINEDDCL